MLSRSSSVPLSLRIRTTFDRSDLGRTKSILFERLRQTEELDIGGISDPLSELLGTALSTPAPLLTTFCISENIRMSLNPLGIPLPNTIFAGYAPCLTKLTITFLWSPPPLPVLLTLLSLSHLFPRLTYVQLHDLLGIMPGLHKLRLSHAIEHDPDSPTPSTLAHLPKLAVLVIMEMTASLCHTTMSQISSLSLTHIHSTVTSIDTDEGDVYYTLLESLITSVTQEQGLQTLWIIVEDDWGSRKTLTIVGSRAVDISDSYDPRCRGILERPEMHHLEHLTKSDSQVRLLDAVSRLASVQLAGIVSLYLTTDSETYSQKRQLVSLLRMMPHLRHICISQGFLPPYGGMMQTILLSERGSEIVPLSLASQDHVTLLLPNLSTLTLHNFDNPLHIADPHDEILLSLKLRRQIHPGHALQKLSLCNCTLDPSYLKELQAIVPTVLCPVSDPARAGPLGKDFALGTVIT